MAREIINGISVPVAGTGEPNDTIADLRRIAVGLNTAVQQTVAEIAGDIVTVVYHGSDPNYPRPDVPGPVLWVGSVTPNLLQAGDLIAFAEEVAVEPDVAWEAEFRAANLAATLANLAPVSSFPNAGVLGGSLPQGTSTAQPVYHAETADQPAYVQSDGNDRLGPLTYSTPIPGPATYIVAFQLPTAPALGSTSTLLDSIDTNARHRIAVTRPDDADDQVVISVQTGTTSKSYEPLPVGSWVILTWIHTGDAGSVIRLNGIDHSAGGTGTQGSNGLNLFANQSGTQGLAMKLHALLIKNGILGLGTVQAVEAALADRLGITLGA